MFYAILRIWSVRKVVMIKPKVGTIAKLYDKTTWTAWVSNSGDIFKSDELVTILEIKKLRYAPAFLLGVLVGSKEKVAEVQITNDIWKRGCTVVKE